MSEQNAAGEIRIFSGESSDIRVQLNGETVWLTQRQMSLVFDTTPENILMHLKNIFKEGELEERATS